MYLFVLVTWVYIFMNTNLSMCVFFYTYFIFVGNLKTKYYEKEKSFGIFHKKKYVKWFVI